MTYPTFIGIGVQRAGTTWLHNLLASHPDVYMPTQRKEIRFFERYYARGLNWYETFFCTEEEAKRYKAIGEISTQYYDCEECPERIYQAFPYIKIIIMLRNPVNRAYSHYGFVVQRRNYRGSFEEFLSSRHKSMEKGFYSRYLKNYLQYFERSQILALIFEEVFTDVTRTKNSLAEFLDISADKFPPTVGKGKVNQSSIPTHQSLYGSIVKAGRRLRKYNLEPLVDSVKGLGIDRILSKGSTLPPLDPEMKKELEQLYLDEYDELERCLQIDLSLWRT
ncbi:MAG: sulfotransferase [Chloroflexota bacterium]|nr:MAG: sulfotransferase [Chloroflexota bacterium]